MLQTPHVFKCPDCRDVDLTPTNSRGYFYMCPECHKDFPRYILEQSHEQTFKEKVQAIGHKIKKWL